MIRFFVGEGGLALKQKRSVRAWLQEVLMEAGYVKANINYIFCDDEYLHRLNMDYLKHDTYTDIITFPSFSEDILQQKEISGECYISTERVAENARSLGVSFTEELHRVMVHGLWHLLGQGDKTEEEEAAMRSREDNSLLMRKFHVEQPAVPKRCGRGVVLRHERQGAGEDGQTVGENSGLFHVEQITPMASPVKETAGGE